jgi:hypothetical protein
MQLSNLLLPPLSVDVLRCPFFHQGMTQVSKGHTTKCWNCSDV